MNRRKFVTMLGLAAPAIAAVALAPKEDPRVRVEEEALVVDGVNVGSLRVIAPEATAIRVSGCTIGCGLDVVGKR